MGIPPALKQEQVEEVFSFLLDTEFSFRVLYMRNALNNCSVGPDGWRTTRNHRSTAQPIYETDEHVAWELQQDEGLFHTLTEHHTSRPRWLQIATSNRQPHLPAHQNPLNRRRAGTQAPRTNRISLLRRGLGHSPTRTISSRGRKISDFLSIWT
ncbi:hypothetical protein L6164_013211 [Bauhinia variegata]|uniref:Uncharacterized protein n=1 Tax=Bauhinia variegata TaxID=167791 RepID=A0ACB9PBN0_BAUVA|nr:hypothetical protein L6164_013211 [Bauhinia variegata]